MKSSEIKTLDAEDTQKLLHELYAHQIELELQNEQLLQAQALLEESRDQYLDLYDCAPVGYLSIDHNGLITKLNLKAAALLDAPRDKILKKPFSRFVVKADVDFWHRQFVWMKSLEFLQEMNFDLRLKHADDCIHYAELSCLRMTNQDNNLLRITLIDVTERKLAEEELRIAAIAFESQEGMMITDANNIILKVNQAFENITGFTTNDVIGKNPNILSSKKHSPDFFSDMFDHISYAGSWHGEIVNRHKNGTLYPSHLIVSEVKNANAQVTHYVGAISDISQSVAAEKEIQHLAYYDGLTDLPNRRLLQERLKLALANAKKVGVKGAVLFLDLDNFKTLNDTLGHDFGGLLLKQVASRLNNCVRETDTIARLGGDEYVLVLEGLNANLAKAKKEVSIITQKILNAISEGYFLYGKELKFTASIGISLFHKRNLKLNELLKQADIALYQAKKAGRNTLRFFDPQMQVTLINGQKLNANCTKP